MARGGWACSTSCTTRFSPTAPTDSSGGASGTPTTTARPSYTRPSTRPTTRSLRRSECTGQSLVLVPPSAPQLVYKGLGMPTTTARPSYTCPSTRPTTRSLRTSERTGQSLVLVPPSAQKLVCDNYVSVIHTLLHQINHKVIEDIRTYRWVSHSNTTQCSTTGMWQLCVGDTHTATPDQPQSHRGYHNVQFNLSLSYSPSSPPPPFCPCIHRYRYKQLPQSRKKSRGCLYVQRLIC